MIPPHQGFVNTPPKIYYIKLEGILPVLGKHFLLDLKDCDERLIDELEHLRNVLISASKKMGGDILKENFFRFEPQGVSGMVLSTGSHISIHTWPEYKYAAVDIFTHTESPQEEEAIKDIIKGLSAKSPSIVELKRGT